jgi:dolichol-phosphate mannosyltransferase
MSSLIALFFLAQTLAALALLRRLARRNNRPRPLLPPAFAQSNNPQRAVTLVIPARNEANRIASCLQGAVRQGPEVAEILVVDDESDDGTAEVARAVGDERLGIVRGKPLPVGWIGKAWALEQGLQAAKTPWILCLDADARPAPGLVAAALRAADEDGVSALSIAPRFIVESAGERWLHPALLTTLIYRLASSSALNGEDVNNKFVDRRRLVSGQCFLFETEALRKAGGFTAVRSAFAEDLAIAERLARHGTAVSFRDGASLLEVKMYRSFKETWTGWGLTLALNENTTAARQLLDVAMLSLVQAAPLPVLAFSLFYAQTLQGWMWLVPALNVLLLLIRLGVLRGTGASYKPATDLYWLSPLADILAVARIVLSAVRPPRGWRGRSYTRKSAW